MPCIRFVKEMAERNANYISHLAHTNYYYLAWENTSPPEVLQAAIESFSGKTARLATIIRENLSHITTEDS